ncbi:MAG: YkvA family protein [Rhodoglobus sp.]
MNNRRRTIAAVLVGLGALVYGISPVDIIPELIAGPLGLTDDLAVLVGAGVGIWKLLSGRSPNTGDSASGGARP